MSADLLDDASEVEALFRDRCIKNARQQKMLPSVGHCYYCNDDVENGRRFCSPECREDWELEQEANRRHNGRN